VGNGTAECYTTVNNEHITSFLNHCCGEVVELGSGSGSEYNPNPNSGTSGSGGDYDVDSDSDFLHFVYSMWQPDLGSYGNINTNSNTNSSGSGSGSGSGSSAHYDSGFIEYISYGASMASSISGGLHTQSPSKMGMGMGVDSPKTRSYGSASGTSGSNRVGPVGCMGWCGSEAQQKLQQPLYDMFRSVFYK